MQGVKMEPEIPSRAPAPEQPQPSISGPGSSNLQLETPEKPYRGLKWIFIGDQRLRSGWSALVFLVLLVAFGSALGYLFTRQHLISKGGFTASNAFFGE